MGAPGTIGAPGLVRRLADGLGLGGLPPWRLRRAMDIPILPADPAAAAAQALHGQIRAMAGRGDWDGIAALMLGWDRARAALPDGQRKAQAARDAALTPAGPGRAALLNGLLARQAQAPGDPMAAVLAAHALIGAGDPALIATARDILDGFEPALHGSPLLAEAQFRLSHALPEGPEAIRAAHDDWADLDPSDPAVWCDLGLALLPDLEGVAVAAARCEWQTARWNGRGGYALPLLPALPAAPELWERIDPAHLAGAAVDLALHRRGDQAAVNRLAATLDRLVPLAPPEAGAELRIAYRDLLERALHALVPAAWGLPEAMVRRRIAAAFLPELRAGARLRATSAGLALCDASALPGP